MDQSGPLYDVDGSCAQLAALRLLSGYNRFMLPPEVHTLVAPLLTTLPPPACLPSYCQHLPVRNTPHLSPPLCSPEGRRRGEKRPIPAELKDDKYYERRRRNNQAAKKSRDARRIREDQIAWRACLLEQENASLRAHVSALRRETMTLRSIIASRDDPLPVCLAAGDDVLSRALVTDVALPRALAINDTLSRAITRDDTLTRAITRDDTLSRATTRDDTLVRTRENNDDTLPRTVSARDEGNYKSVIE